MAYKVSNAAARAACDAQTALCNAGGGPALLRIYSGSVPSDVDASLGAAVLIAELVMSATAYAASVDINPGARATANAIADDVSANADGTASFFRVYQSNGTVAVFQGACGTSGAELILNALTFLTGGLVQVSSLTHTVPEG